MISDLYLDQSSFGEKLDYFSVTKSKFHLLVQFEGV